MPKKSKKLEEIQNLFGQYSIDECTFSDLSILTELETEINRIEDKRHQSYILHKLSDIVMITLLAILANANEWKEIEWFGKKKEKWLKTFLELPNGTPCDDTIKTVISSIDSTYLNDIIVGFLIKKINITLEKKNIKIEEEKDILAIDGKTSCGSKRNETDKSAVKALHTLSAYSTNYGMCLAQVHVDEKTNEIPAMIDLIKILNIKDKILTWDALNTQKTTVRAVISKGGDYIGALKGNHQNLYKDVKDYFTEEVTKEIIKNNNGYKKTVEKEHSAIITREYFLSNDIKWLYGKEEWSGLESIGMEKKTIKNKNGKTHTENRYFIVSFYDIENFSRGVREHWGIENGLHWYLDATFKDDKNTTFEKNAAKNLQIFKKVSLAILKLVKPVYKKSLKGIRYNISLETEKELENIFKILNLGELKTVLKINNIA